MALNVRTLSSQIAGNTVVRQVSFALEKGKTTALIGRNGAGKTSLLRTIMGLLPVSEGEMEFQGANLNQRQAHDRPMLGIGYAPEERRLIAKFTVLDNMLVPAWACKLSQAEIGRRLALIYSLSPELEQIGSRLGGLISGGQQKMVALGRALMAGDKLILLDEPFQGLAPALAIRYAESLKALRQAQPDLSILITESNPKLLEPIADQFLTIERGSLVA
ncbi:ATP-binding cassette domain-containing protein [Alcaligenaceae bacterium 429]|nr:ATP-binding cassette domain-containing protein [Alcaligenaceae bacterium 429]